MVDVQQAFYSMTHHLPVLLAILAFMWMIHIINISVDYRLNVFGVIPRRRIGLFGIICSPFLHGDFGHLLSNSLMFLILGMLVISYGLYLFIVASILIIVLSGILTWLFARKAIHVGASSLIMGYWSFLLVLAYFYPSAFTIFVAGICILQLGYLVYSLMPTGARVSWEGHVFGFISGIITCFLLPLVMPYLYQLLN
ncbi:rhomboid family intramembrane serine protease [Thiotrichales bacterium 19S3-7]|nr:rhomboid family intramembrane serine protease [Thiotrichales bacterium 19S3-7]MCF6801642.1 rhomboid family intramembrane serine protease [Thiotrichales bacterium 19S3-11]